MIICAIQSIFEITSHFEKFANFSQMRNIFRICEKYFAFATAIRRRKHCAFAKNSQTLRNAKCFRIFRKYSAFAKNISHLRRRSDVENTAHCEKFANASKCEVFANFSEIQRIAKNSQTLRNALYFRNISDKSLK